MTENNLLVSTPGNPLNYRGYQFLIIMGYIDMSVAVHYKYMAANCRPTHWPFGRIKILLRLTPKQLP